MAVGTQKSGELSRYTPRNVAGATPTTVNGVPLRVSVWPTIAGLAPRLFCQKV